MFEKSRTFSTAPHKSQVANALTVGYSRTMIKLLLSLLLVLVNADYALAWVPTGRSASWLDNPRTPIIGQNRSYIIGPDETLMEIAVRAEIGFDNLLRANPKVDPWHPEVGSSLILPLSFLPPSELVEGVTINLAEMRLFLVWTEEGQRRVRAYALGIGREGWETPLGDFTITRSLQNPSWTPPQSLRKEKPDLPGIIPPGPDNPLGDYWIGTTAPGIGLHGTNQPFGVGRRVSHGCLRLYPRDIRDLASRVYPGMPLRIINRPLKTATRGSNLFLESHPGINPDPPTPPLTEGSVQKAIHAASGLPLVFPRNN